ncbi:short-chain dehydrogenase TIC 32, chloroplastic [Aspergillus udagawae]|uniref:Short-chain dehydrogenase TIC 32, chloroplastic n=1 Tax=Aspergillus udagawae TaxID=91492 RepID=A0ABQ1AXF6_9EURO|nr:short-chain dehydrogenase TIC 32, chloroplastic [Aspergillus udagawae]GFF89800.1 short-chain dehydrogenase TIC 32, chloroplastic [Aspergillus udagawae]GFG10618.1 short-chain dehydrogenase TIC 32, chloroplastic [Aspergillus udagawae]
MASAVQTQCRNLPLLATTETCSGGTYIVTGANTGLGFEAAKHLVSLEAAKVILAVRNLSAGEKAKKEIEESTGNIGVAEVWSLDLARYDSVKAFAQKATAELDRIDAVIENAAVAVSERVLAEGHGLAVTVNVLSTFLLAVLILPKMRESAQRYGIVPHLTLVTSRVGFDAKDQWDNIKDDPVKKMDGDDIPPMRTYPLSKVFTTMALRYLATLIPVDHTGVVLNLVCPGLCKTDLSRNAPAQFREDLAKLHAEYGRTAEDGSRTLLHGAVAGKESHGCLLHSCEIGE